MPRFILLLFVVALLLVANACMGLTSKTATPMDTAMSDDLPSKLKEKKSDNSKAAEIDNQDLHSPLEKQLTQLRGDLRNQRSTLAENQNKSEELSRRSNELRGSVQLTEAKITKIEKVMTLINENPQAIDNVPLNAGQNLAMRGGENYNSFNFREDEMPTLASENERAPRNDWINDNSAKLFNDKKPSKQLTPDFEQENAVWNAPTPPISSTRETPVKILLCDGDGAGATFIISKSPQLTLKEGMLFKADDKNILVVTKVYAANAEARLHPSFATGGLKSEMLLTPINSLPH